jgi:glycosyltransferase involved in cell wall biosynthesis
LVLLIESLIYCTESYANKEIIVVDNCSIETGTDEYLQSLKDRGFHVHKTDIRDPENEFAKALNYINSNAKGEYICPLAGDMQFIVKGRWLEKYVEFHEKFRNFVGCISFDAQRRVTLNNLVWSNDLEEYFKFRFEYTRQPFAPSCNTFFHRDRLKIVGSWSEYSNSHEGNQSAESIIDKGLITWNQVIPRIPVSAAIYTDPRGTMARIRGNKIFGKYFKPKESFKYYKIHDLDSLDRDKQYSIEDIVETIGYDKPLDEKGNWLKNPIRPEDCNEEDYRLIT